MELSSISLGFMNPNHFTYMSPALRVISGENPTSIQDVHPGGKYTQQRSEISPARAPIYNKLGFN